MGSLNFLKENLQSSSKANLVDLYIEGVKQYVCFNPVYDEGMGALSFPDISIGEQKTISGKMKRISDLHQYEKTEGIVALYYDGIIRIADLLTLRDKGILYLVGTQKFLCNLLTTGKIPFLLCDEHRMIDSVIGEDETFNVEITIDLSMFECMNISEGIRLIYDKTLDGGKLKERINISLEQIESLSTRFHVGIFDLYYFESMNQLHIFTGMQSTFAYKDKMVFLTYSDIHNNTEIHEMLHVFLYKLGDPPFLLKEGIPSLGYELCRPRKKYSRYVCNIFMRNRLLKNLPYKDINRLVGRVTSDRQYSGEDYYTAASFLLWLYFEKGFDTVLDCYRLMKRENTSEQNLVILQSVVGENYENMVARWKEKIMLK